MTRSSNSPLTPQFQEPEQEFRRRRRHARLMADIANLSLEEYASRTQEETGQGLVRPTIPDRTHFEIKGQFLHLLRETLFTGKDAEDANQHVESVLEIADYFHIPGVTKDAVMLRMDDETLYDAWDRYKEMLQNCPQHDLNPHQVVQTFYNGINVTTRQMVDSQGPIPKKTPADGYALIEELAQHSHQWHSSRDSSLRKKPSDEQADGLAALNAKLDALGRDMKKESVCYSSGDRFDERRPRNNNWKPYEEYKKDQAEKYKQSGQGYYQREPSFHPQSQPEKKPSFEEMMARFAEASDKRHRSTEELVKKMGVTTESALRNQQASILNIETQVGQISRVLHERFPGTLPSNTEQNPNAHVKAISTRSGKILEPSIPINTDSSSKTQESKKIPEKNEEEAEERPPPTPVKSYKPPVPYPQRLKKEKQEEEYKKFLEHIKSLHINIPFVEAVAQMPKYAKFLKDLLTNRKKLEEASNVILNEQCSAAMLNKLPKKMTDPGSLTLPCQFGNLTFSHALADSGASINLMPYSFYSKLDLPEPKPTRMAIHLANKSITYPRGIVEDLLVKVDKFVFPADFVVLDMEEDEQVPIILGRPFLSTARALVDIRESKLTLRVGTDAITFGIDQSMKHSKTCDDAVYFVDTFDTILEDELQELEKRNLESMMPMEEEEFNANEEIEKLEKLLKVPSNSSTTNENQDSEPKTPNLNTLHPHLEYAYLDESMQLPVIINAFLSIAEKTKLVAVLKKRKRIIYPISDSPWVSPIHAVPKNGGITVLKNEKDELIPTRTVTGWRVCIDYRKLNDATRKDHFPLPFIDQMLERLAGKTYYCFLDGFSRYFQIPIDPLDQEKTTFTCPYGTFAYRRMPFGLCNAPATFQRCMTAIFHEMVGDFMEVFMDDFSVFGDTFDECLTSLDKMLERCEKTNLVLNWEKCNFMVQEGIVLGHKVSKQGIEVDKAKDFSKIARPLTQLLLKEVKFEFSTECLNSFNTLKENLVSSPILIAPNWNLPFELMCDASDYAVGAVLGQRVEKHFQPIFYASKTLNPAQENYTTTEKELLAVVYAFDKFRPYLILSKTTVFTDHSALKYLFSKQDAKPRLIRWILLLQEFDLEIKDKPGMENVAADHLSRLENPKMEQLKETDINDNFPDE
ncbi:hypothetical protein L2E82_16199 [Cichorium intybus]|uniref:Uncharacterized protein n=1 Tax=Cichorium intybus TaxID=13427 RepID=A0ACB9F483_CICIN|nr:hypothetical protein L2E82_16199 [Cichorium intybus]